MALFEELAKQATTPVKKTEPGAPPLLNSDPIHNLNNLDPYGQGQPPGGTTNGTGGGWMKNAQGDMVYNPMGNPPGGTTDGTGGLWKTDDQGTLIYDRMGSARGDPLNINKGYDPMFPSSVPPYAPTSPTPETPAAPIADPFQGLAPDSTGLQPGTPVPGAEGLDFLKKGAAETFFDDVSGKFKEPTMSEGFAKDTLDKYKGGTPGMTNRADEAYQAFLQSAPADMSGYYDNAKRRAAESIDNKVAARGLYGSSAANDLIRESDENLEADRAGKEANYGLQRAGLGGQLATSSDASSRSASDLDRTWQSLLSGIAGQGDSSGLSRLLGGMTAASGAQGAQRTRGQDFFNNNLAMGDSVSRAKSQGYGGMFANDKDLFAQYLAGLVGEGAEKQGQATHDAAQARADDQAALDKIGNYFKLGTGINETLKKGKTPGYTSTGSLGPNGDG